MIDKIYLDRVRDQIADYSQKRREIIKLSSDILHNSKKAIFAMQRDDLKEAGTYLAQATKSIKEINKKHKSNKKLMNEGSYKAGQEEFVEACLFQQFVTKKKLGKVTINIEPELYISGLCDVPGEILRYAIKSATERNFDEVKRCYKVAEEIIGATMNMNLTGYNRQKFDQSKGALNKLQHIVYEVSMKD